MRIRCLGEIMAATATFIGGVFEGGSTGRFTLTVFEKSTTTASESPPQPEIKTAIARTKNNKYAFLLIPQDFAFEFTRDYTLGKIPLFSHKTP